MTTKKLTRRPGMVWRILLAMMVLILIQCPCHASDDSVIQRLYRDHDKDMENARIRIDNSAKRAIVVRKSARVSRVEIAEIKELKKTVKELQTTIQMADNRFQILKMNRDRIAGEKTRIIREKEAMVNEKTRIIREKEAVVNENKKIVKEKKEIVKEKDFFTKGLVASLGGNLLVLLSMIVKVPHWGIWKLEKELKRQQIAEIKLQIVEREAEIKKKGIEIPDGLY